MSQSRGRSPVWAAQAAGLVVVLALGVTSSAQTALRLRGSARAAAGETPVVASIDLEARYGYRGLDFVGQKTFTAKAGGNGQWSVLGVTSGAWFIGAQSPNYLPQALVLPIQFTQKNPLSAAGAQLPWDVGFDLVPREAHPALAAAADAAMAGRRAEMAEELAAVFETGAADALVAAGEIALYARDSGLARAIFQRAVTVAPDHGRAHLGVASTAMFDGQWDIASKALWTARDKGVSPRIARAVGAAITELQRITRPDGDVVCPPGGIGC
jgi:hypothetical protein